MLEYLLYGYADSSIISRQQEVIGVLTSLYSILTHFITRLSAMAALNERIECR